MVRDPAETKRKILHAATAEFTERGLAGTRMEAIAARAGVNKERVYSNYGTKEHLFAVVLGDELERIASAVPIDTIGADGVGEFAARCFDYHLDHPELVRLLHWEALERTEEIADEAIRTQHYQRKVAAFRRAQAAGILDDGIDAADMVFMVLALSAWWAAVPQVAHMVGGPSSDSSARQRRRTSVANAARKMCAAP
ncbi:TetR/AcrR family transcriptional regulator [Amnibacterium setariae]|uniref:TetR/AcrR family transcriptional regulator n=1 Tax=Amnibacterium setariae TaxID=2306585 RepID=A0A3A1TXY6_9MICO|nr:TetR family transcriptional regulator [Amnibacterium setariae]RIX28659.1 TetR/AcrR family transcriptional regulator [Amnibacterium setariae]